MKVYGVPEAAARLGIDASLVRRYCRQGRIKATRPVRDWLIEESEMARLEAERREKKR